MSADPTPQHTENPDPLLSPRQAGEYTGRGTRYFHRMTHERRLPHIRIGGRVFFRKSVLDALLDASSVPAERAPHELAERTPSRALPPPRTRRRPATDPDQTTQG